MHSFPHMWLTTNFGLFRFAFWINIWRIIHYLSHTSFIYRVEIIRYTFQFCYGWSTFCQALQAMSQTLPVQFETALAKTPVLKHADNALVCTTAHKHWCINKHTDTGRQKEVNNSHFWELELCLGQQTNHSCAVWACFLDKQLVLVIWHSSLGHGDV